MCMPTLNGYLLGHRPSDVCAQFERVPVRTQILPTYIPSLKGQNTCQNTDLPDVPAQFVKTDHNSPPITSPGGLLGTLETPSSSSPYYPIKLKKRYVSIALLYSSCLSLNNNNNKNATRNISAMKSTWNQPMFEIIIIDKK